MILFSGPYLSLRVRGPYLSLRVSGPFLPVRVIKTCSHHLRVSKTCSHHTLQSALFVFKGGMLGLWVWVWV